MNRCVTLLAAALIAWAAPAAAQMPRNFPADALRGDFMVTAPPQVSLNGQLVQLAPGARIRGTNNLLQLSGPLVGQRLLVNFTVDTMGFVRDVWILTPMEAANLPWPTTIEQARTWLFNPATQTWMRP